MLNKEKANLKRQDYIAWDEYFMGIALLAAKRSKDPNTQVGAAIVNEQNKIISTGYNGFPVGCNDDDFPWAREGAFAETKYAYVCHAELNAILNNPGASLAGCRIYVALFPCNECAKAIIQARLQEVVYLSNKYAASDNVKASKLMLETAGVKLRQMQSQHNQLTLDFSIE